MSLSAIRVLNHEEAETRGLQPGLFWWTSDQEGNRYLAYVCPCGCGQPRAIPTAMNPGATAGRGPWTWDGNEDVPTLTPSIQHRDACQWHGFLTVGQWVTV